jgi:cyclopropane fatty-acyl-phospholipid synthase-like methyltransferase
MDRKQHWEQVYRQKPEDNLSWFQPRPDLSLELIHAASVRKTDAVIDVGGGTSRLVDYMLLEEFTDITVLDIAEQALRKVRARLADAAMQVHWVAADIARWQPDRKYRVWHDRAVFHFLTDPAERAAYRQNLQAALATGGTAIIASFAADGPERCSGLPVRRYSPGFLAAELGPGFRLIRHRDEAHRTPANKVQQFQYSVFEYHA